MKLALVLAALAGSPARAESFAPVGLWRGERSGDLLVVAGADFCSLAGAVTIAGPCTWAPEPGTRAGTLSVTAVATQGPPHLDLAVRWVDADTILLGEERFERRG